MLFSKYFCPILKENPKDALIASHTLMIKSGLIRQTSSGIYIWLPMGLKILNKISAIIKDEMDQTGALNVLMPTIQSADIWQESGRYEDYGLEMLRIKDRHERDFLYSPTNEEQITQIFRDNVQSHKDLPLNLYQINWKFRDEIRPRFGVMRGREFLMKDAYSFDQTPEGAVLSYKKMFAAYLKIFQRLGLQAIPMQADTGPIGGDLSHEFIILATTGESEVYYDKSLLNLDLLDGKINYDLDVENIYNLYTAPYASTEDKHTGDNPNYLKNQSSVVKQKGIEVGHIFYFADKYSLPMKAKILDKNGQNINVLMGSYGIGISRLMGAIIEASYDDKGIIWPYALAPFTVIINSLGNNHKVKEHCFTLYNYLIEQGVDVLYNDKDDSVSSKLNSTDLLGIPKQINIGSKSLESGRWEIKDRKTGKVTQLAQQDLPTLLTLLK
ncbi:Proline--tRNA ligase [Candidatus Hepatincolaceae symbiont of Richtersius coronifer]